ncbi:MAG: porin family protein [Nitrospira sp.]|nr:MAG: porin family protein [Nitrospira sp.]
MKQVLLQVKVRGMAMKTTQMARRFIMTGLLALLIPIVLTTPQAYAETYVAGQLGMTFPQALSSGPVTQDGFAGLTVSEQSLKNSLMLGAKIGHYFSRAKWIGIESGLSFANPHIKEGNITLSNSNGSASGTFGGVHQRMIIWDMATLMFRYPGYRLQPYIGIGPALFLAKLSGPDAPPGQSATTIGLNAEGGVRYYMTRDLALFGEMQYHRARLGYISNDSDPNADPFGFRSTYSALTLSLGVSYHF